MLTACRPVVRFLSVTTYLTPFTPATTSLPPALWYPLVYYTIFSIPVAMTYVKGWLILTPGTVRMVSSEGYL